MCRMLYIASNVELPLLPWDGDDPGFHVTKLGDTEAAVKQISKMSTFIILEHMRDVDADFRQENFQVMKMKRLI